VGAYCHTNRTSGLLRDVRNSWYGRNKHGASDGSEEWRLARLHGPADPASRSAPSGTLAPHNCKFFIPYATSSFDRYRGLQVIRQDAMSTYATKDPTTRIVIGGLVLSNGVTNFYSVWGWLGSN